MYAGVHYKYGNIDNLFRLQKLNIINYISLAAFR